VALGRSSGSLLVVSFRANGLSSTSVISVIGTTAIARTVT
jgi:hypothetical protein